MPLEQSDQPSRRPLASRSAGWAQWLAVRLSASRITPNQVSCLSIAFAAGGSALLVWQATAVGLCAAAACIQLRLVCNLIDGMVAIEGGKRSPLGVIYNEFPDRIADSLLLVALGYSAGIPWLGWLCALLAALTAYVRVFGGSVGLAQDFSGIMAKQRRMAVLTAACVAGAVEISLWHTLRSLEVAAWVIGSGSLITCLTRTARLADGLRAR